METFALFHCIYLLLKTENISITSIFIIQSLKIQGNTPQCYSYWSEVSKWGTNFCICTEQWENPFDSWSCPEGNHPWQYLLANRSEEKIFSVLKFSTREKEEGEDNLKIMDLFLDMASNTLADFYQVIKLYLNCQLTLQTLWYYTWGTFSVFCNTMGRKGNWHGG